MTRGSETEDQSTTLNLDLASRAEAAQWDHAVGNTNLPG